MNVKTARMMMNVHRRAQDAVSTPTARLDGEHPLTRLAQDRRLRVLVVESNHDLFDSIARALRVIQIAVFRAADAAAASSHIHRSRPDVIISNLMPADESGWLMVGKWRLTDPHLPVWFYASERSNRDDLWAGYAHVKELIYYGDNWRFLISAIIDRLTAFQSNESCGRQGEGAGDPLVELHDSTHDTA